MSRSTGIFVMIHHQLFSPKMPLEEHIRFFLLSKISLHTMEEVCGLLHVQPIIFADTPSRCSPST